MSFFLTTTKNTFEGKRDGEVVLLLVRKHSIILWMTIAGFIVLMALPLFVLISFYNFVDAGGSFWLALSVVTALFILVWHALFYKVMDYLLDTWIITNERVISSQQLGFFKRRVVEANLGRVQDVTVEIKSMIPTLLNFGNIEVQTAGAEQKIFFNQVPDPHKIKALILNKSKDLGNKTTPKNDGL